MSPNRASLLRHLEQIGLPHATPLRELIAQHGLVESRYYDSWDVLRFEHAQPFVEGQVAPFEVAVLGPPFAPDLLPAARFSAFVAPSPDARANHAHACSHIAARYGPGLERASSNTLCREWLLGTACIRLTTWPPDLERSPMRNPSHERHPEMRAFTHLTIETGHVVALRPGEEEGIRTRIPFSPLPPGARPVVAPLDHEMVRGTTRWLSEDLASAGPDVGMARDVVVGVDGRRAFVVERSDVRGLELVRAARARGPGHAVLTLIFEDAWSTRRERRHRTLFQGAAPRDLDAVTEHVAAALAIAPEIVDCFDD